jgi:hypothetical protein
LERELRPIQLFVVHKEKEMNFRRCILAMAMLALFTSLASAQVIIGTVGGAGSPTISCAAQVANPNTLRSEGMTELLGDIVIECNGGAPLAVGAPIQTVNITVSLATNVTSRLVSASGTTAIPSNTSEALLLIDEPNTSANGNSGAGPQAAFNVCPNSALGASAGGCAQTVVAGTGGINQSGTCTTSGGVTTCTAGYNVFQGLVTANQVTFIGVPVNPPATNGVVRRLRITDVRANVSALGGGGLAGTTPLFASITVSAGSLPVTNPVPIVGFIQAGLTASLRSATNTANSSGSSSSLAQCGGSSGPAALTVLRYSENFPSAFKTRFNGGAATGAGQNVPNVTNVGSESGLVLAVNGGITAGQADYGTRLKAVFNNVPAGVRLFVSTTNITNDYVNAGAAVASLVLSETAPEGQVAPSTATFSGNGAGNTINLAELTVVNGTATAVWEVLTSNPFNQETDVYQFGVYQQFTANPGANSPPTGTATVNMSYAPTAPVPFTAAAGGAASSSLTIPRFADTSSGTNIFSIALCQTVLLFPFVTNLSGFDTGIAIANTTTDPFGTRVQNGSCTLNFYGTAAPAAVTTGNIATATVYTTLASTSAAGFQGYMIAVCNFQLAHGFAFISDIGARNLAMGYLALVVQTGTGNRNSGSLGGALPNSIEILGN